MGFPSAPSLREEARTLVAKGDFETAIKLYQRLVELEPAASGDWNALGMCYLQLGYLKRARGAFSVALKQDPKNPDALKHLAQVSQALEDYEIAAEYLEQSLAVTPDDVVVAFNLGNTYRDLDRYGQAVAAFERALEINPEFTPALVNLGELYLTRRRYERAIPLLERAVELGSQAEIVHTNLGIAYAQAGNLSKALSAVTKAIKANPANPEGWTLLALVHRLDLDPDQAIAAVERAIARGPKQARTWAVLGDILLYFGEETRALDAFRHGRAIDADHPMILELEEALEERVGDWLPEKNL